MVSQNITREADEVYFTLTLRPEKKNTPTSPGSVKLTKTLLFAERSNRIAMRRHRLRHHAHRRAVVQES